MDLQYAFNFVLTVLLTIFGSATKMFHGKLEEVTKDLSRFKEHVAQNHPTHDSIDKRFDKLDAKLDRLDDKLDIVLTNHANLNGSKK